MSGFEPPLRLGIEADAPVLAVLMDAASHGLSPIIWQMLAGEGGDPWEAGVARQARRARDGLWVVADEGAGAVAALLAVPPDVDPPGDEVPALLHPLVELEALAPDALYINVLATLPEAQRRGHAARLLRHAEAMARASGRPRLSLIVSDDNAPALRLYARSGFRPVAARSMVKEGWDGTGSEWLLLVRDLD